jgi:hypothetical protein
MYKSYIPSEWCLHSVTPIPKLVNKSVAFNYHPISLSVAKLFEKLRGLFLTIIISMCVLWLAIETINLTFSDVQVYTVMITFEIFWFYLSWKIVCSFLTGSLLLLVFPRVVLGSLIYANPNFVYWEHAFIPFILIPFLYCLLIIWFCYAIGKILNIGVLNSILQVILHFCI